MQDMPKKGLYLFFVILGFFLGVIWGALSIGPYRKLSAAIQDGDSSEAWDNASKIKIYLIIGVIVNVIFFFIRMVTER